MLNNQFCLDFFGIGLNTSTSPDVGLGVWVGSSVVVL